MSISSLLDFSSKLYENESVNVATDERKFTPIENPEF